jgi:hypothetical protein
MKPAVILLCCLSWMAPWFNADAQTLNGVDQLVTELKKVQAAYKAHPLSFDVKYTYAGDSAPDRALDSLSGRMEMAGDNYRCLIDSTETIRNSRYNITLFKEDKVMYVSKPSVVASGTDPLQVMRSAMQRSGAGECNILREGRNKIFRISFKEGSPYRKMEMTVDTTSGYITGMRYIVKTVLLMESQDNKEAAAQQGYDEYAVVQVSYSAYRKIPADLSRFNEHTYFRKEGSELLTTEAYNDYKLFVGTPNL